MADSAFSPLESHVDRRKAVNTSESSVERLTREGLISMKGAAGIYGRDTHKSTPTRHALKGVRVNGQVIKLEAIRVSGALCTSRAAVLRFFEAQQSAESDAAPVPTPAQRNRAAESAHTELAELLGT